MIKIRVNKYFAYLLLMLIISCIICTIILFDVQLVKYKRLEESVQQLKNDLIDTDNRIDDLKLYLTTFLEIEELEDIIPTTTYEKAKADIKIICDENDLNFQIVFAICRLETGNFTSKAFLECNNYCGISRAEVPVAYKTKEQGLEAMRTTMLMYKGMSVDQMSKKYCPVNAKNWATSVKQLIIEEVENGN